MSIDRAKAQKAAQKYLAKGQIDRAIAEYEKVVQSDPNDARSLLKLGDLYTRRGDSRGAVTTYRKVAGQYAAQGFFLKAVAVFKQILKLDPGDLAAHESLAEMYEKLSLISDAAATYEHVADAHANAGRPDKALNALGRLAELDKDNVAAWVRYAEALSKADRIDEASAAFRRGADLLKQQNRMDDFIKVTERLLFHSHEDLDRARELATLYIERNQPKAALLHLQTCFKADARHPQTLTLLARAFAALDQRPKAVSVYKELARVHAEAGDVTAESETLRELLGYVPDEPEAQRRLSELSSGGSQASVEVDADELDEVMVVDEDDASAARPSSAPLSPDMERETQIARLMAECDVFTRYGLRDKVISQLKRVLEVDPLHRDARERLKEAYKKRGDRADAVAHLLVLADQADDPAQARAYLEEASDLDPSNVRVIARMQAVPSASRPPASDDDEVIFVDEDDSDGEVSFADLTEEGSDAAPGADELQIVGISNIPPPLEVPERPVLGPREVSLASALEGPADEPTYELEQDDEPELVLEDGDESDDAVPEEVEDALGEADFYLGQRLFDEAREVLVEAMYEHPHDLLNDKLAEIDALESGEAPAADQSFALAEKLAAQGAGAATGPVEVGEVLAKFREGVARQVDKSDTATHYDLGIAYMEMGLHEEAIEEFKLCLESGERAHTAHTMIGLSYVAKGDMKPAIEHFQIALRSDQRTADDEVTLWFEIGNAYELLKRASQALVYYEKVEEARPGFRDVALRIERLGVRKTVQQETDEFDEMFDNMIVKD